jgi:hypothetical protein
MEYISQITACTLAMCLLALHVLCRTQVLLAAAAPCTQQFTMNDDTWQSTTHVEVTNTNIKHLTLSLLMLQV